MKVALLTLGCRVNQSESSIIEGTLKQNGITIVNLNENPAYCIINTCTVTSKSDYNSRQLIRRAAKAGAKIIVTGCYSQLKKDEVEGFPCVIDVIDNKRKYDIINLITNKSTELNFGYYSFSRPNLKVQDGCNYKCSYCSVPLARGKSVSVPIDVIIERAKIIEKNGYNEIVLTGIHLGSYGYDLPDKTNLNKLLITILKKTNIKRIRLSSLDLNEINDELIELFQDKRMCKHLHVPLQSGCDRILELMNRNYNSKKILKKIEKISTNIKNISIGTDIIIGFPSESEFDFKDTYKLINDLPFSYLHIFPFSPRINTEAFRMTNSLSHNTVKNRIETLSALNKLKKHIYLQNQINRTLDIILEENISDNFSLGTSGNYIKFIVPSNDYHKGSLVYVRSMRIANDYLEGIVIH